jgi:hypothetical protein
MVLPFWEAFVQRRSKIMKSRGLNVRVSTLTGKKSEDVLRQCIAKDFPNNLNINIWKTSEQERIFTRSKRLSDYAKEKAENGIKVKTKEIKTLNRYVKSYQHETRKECIRRDRIEDLFSKKPYRDNPFL